MVILFDQFNMSEDIFTVIFATEQQVIVAKVLIDFMKTNGGTLNKTEMSFLANQLHEGKYETFVDVPNFKGKKVKLAYNKRQFYDRILTPMKSMGLVKYDLYEKTYSIDESFNRLMVRIGMMWISELKKKPIPQN